MRNLTSSIFVIVLSLISISSFAEAIWIDVRSLPEHTIDHIEGDLRITHTEIVEQVSNLYPTKDIEIYLYCRSGGRAGKAMSALQAAGYNNVSNVGSISDARKKRNLTEH